MKWLVRVIAGLVGLVAVGLLALALLVPRLLDRPEVRARIADGARDATGREFTWDRLEIAWMPPGFEVTEAVLEPAGDEAPLGADRVALRVDLFSLLGGVIAVDSLEIEGASLEIVRGKDGIEFPIEPPVRPEPPEREEAPAGARESEAPEERPDAVDGGSEDPISLAVREVRLRGARVVVVDRTTAEPTRLVLVGIDAEAHGQLDPTAPIAFEISGALESGGDLRATGEASLSGGWSGRIELADLALVAFAAWIEGTELSGSVDIRVDAEGTGGDVARLDLAVDGENLRIVRDDLVLTGEAPMTLVASGRAAGGYAGPFEVDLSGAAIQSGDAFTKPVGDALAVTGQLVWDGDEALGLENASVTLPGVVATGRFQLAPVPGARVSTPVFDPAPLAVWVPALAGTPVTGRIGLEDWSVALEPLTLAGALHLEAVRMPLEAGVAEISGMLEGSGDGVVGSGLEVRVAEQLLAVSLRASALDTKPRARVEVEGRGLDSAALLAAVGGPADTLSGPLDLQAVIEAPLDSDREISQVARGRAQFQVAPGRLRGVSLLRSTFDAFGAFGDVALFAGQTFGGSTLQKFYGEDFERLSGSTAIANGIARTDDLRLEYHDYSADLAGDYRLADQGIDMTGQLTLYEKIDRALAATTPGAIQGEAPKRAVEKVIPLARITGTLEDPKVRVTRATVVAFTRSYLDKRDRLGRLEREVDERLGEGAGKAVFDVLEGILGGERREER